MAAFAETFQKWRHFPKGLRVLLVDSDEEFLRDSTLKLQSYGYLVTSFSSGHDACAALTNYKQIFHVALVQATERNDVDTCKILEYSRQIPMIMISEIENMSIMVKTIALGAVEFLLKPLSEDKLKNIWQHVVRKALDSRESLRPGYLEPETNNYHHKEDSDESEINRSGNSGEMCHIGSQSTRLAVNEDRFPAPSTPQLEQGGRQEEGPEESPRSHDLTERCSFKGMSHAALSVSSVSNENTKAIPMSVLDSVDVKKEEDSSDCNEVTCCTIQKLQSVSQDQNVDATQSTDTKQQGMGKSVREHCGLESDERALVGVKKDDVNENQSVEESIIQTNDLRVNMDCMNTDSMSSSQSFGHVNPKLGLKRKSNGKRSNQKRQMKESGLQEKYHFGKDMEANNWHQSKVICGKPSNKGRQNKMQIRPRIQPPAICPFPPLYVWGHPAVDSSTVHVMPQYSHLVVPGMCYGAPYYGPHMFSGSSVGYAERGLTFSTLDDNDAPEATNRCRNSRFLDIHPTKELIDAAISEALNDPWAPLPLGLKPPSMESVMAELQQQGIDSLALGMYS